MDIWFISSPAALMATSSKTKSGSGRSSTPMSSFKNTCISSWRRTRTMLPATWGGQAALYKDGWFQDAVLHILYCHLLKSAHYSMSALRMEDMASLPTVHESL